MALVLDWSVDYDTGLQTSIPTTSYPVALPGAAAEGHLMVLAAAVFSFDGSNDSIGSPGAGWNEVFNLSMNTAAENQYAAWWKVCSASEPDPEFTVTGNHRQVGAILAGFTGVPGPLKATTFGAVYYGVSSDLTMDCSAATAADSTVAVYCGSGTTTGTGSITVSPGWTGVQNNPGRSASIVSKDGVTADFVRTVSNVNFSYYGAALVFGPRRGHHLGLVRGRRG